MAMQTDINDETYLLHNLLPFIVEKMNEKLKARDSVFLLFTRLSWRSIEW